MINLTILQFYNFIIIIYNIIYNNIINIFYKMKEYLVHGTNYDNLIKILQDGYIDNNPIPKNLMGSYDKNPKQIFTQLVYYNIPSQDNERPHWWTCAIILDKSLLKDYPFYATYVKGFKTNFNNGLINNNTNPKYDKQILVRGKGQLSKIPKLTKLKHHIVKHMTLKRPKEIDNFHDKFQLSHEILFNQKIPLDKYCINIILQGTKEQYKKYKNKDIDKIIKFAKEKNIPIKYRDYKLRGKNNKPINNFINSIESN